MGRIGRRWLALGLVLLGGAAGARSAGGRWPDPMEAAAPSVPRDNPMNEAKVALGRRLFYDADLSVDGTMACATCHEQHRGFADSNRTHPGVHGEPARRNVPGLANVAWLPSFTWGDPRIRSLEAQVLVPVLGAAPVEMGMKGQEREIAARLSRDPCYRVLFRAAFPERAGRIDMAAVARALATFERSLVSFDAPYDRARRGEEPLGPVERAGAGLFRRDCASCHAGPNFSDGRFHRAAAWTASDRGLGEITSQGADDGKFRTPILRNVAVTAPYLHDGSASSLEQAITAHVRLSDPAELRPLVAFLATLTDAGFLSDRRFALPDTACEGGEAEQAREQPPGAAVQRP